MTDYRQRVHSAVRILREYACRTEFLTLCVSPDVFQKMMTDSVHDQFGLTIPLVPAHGYRYLGMALAVDGDYPSDTIALRFEVKA